VEAYDYIVVGAGTAGCVLAARLSENPAARVLLLEAGSADRTRAMTVPNAWPENLGSAADWGYVTTGQAGAGPLPYPRGRTLGGSGAINAMAHVRGHRVIYDRWAEAGAQGWGSDDLLPFFKMTERADRRDPVLRGTDGPILVALPVHRGRVRP
jgi:choline dehydrogenase-like flavoprotein